MGEFKFFITSIYFFLFFNIGLGFSQIKVDDKSFSETQLIEKLSGKGVKISNIKINCPNIKNSPAFGYFIDNTGSLGIESGLTMTTGAAKNALGPNDDGGKSQNNGHCNDIESDLIALLTDDKKLCDVCKIEFDITVDSDLLLFNYVFGSEEYPEYVENYHDIFGFFISGPGIIGTKNLAVLSNSNLPVDVHTINANSNKDLYINNGDGSLPYENVDLQYDGFTTVLVASSIVIPCQTYHLKLIIADVLDEILDSGFFKRNTSDRSNSININYDIKGSAANGIDFLKISNNAIIPIGKDSTIIVIEALSDSLLDNEEIIHLYIKNICAGMPPQDTIEVLIKEFFSYKLPKAKICKGDSIVLNSKPFKNYYFSWENSQSLSCINCPSPYAKPEILEFFKFNILDSISGCKSYDSVAVDVVESPHADFNYNQNPNFTLPILIL